jgi:hypothetical protein
LRWFDFVFIATSINSCWGEFVSKFLLEGLVKVIIGYNLAYGLWTINLLTVGLVVEEEGRLVAGGLNLAEISCTLVLRVNRGLVHRQLRLILVSWWALVRNVMQINQILGFFNVLKNLWCILFNYLKFSLQTISRWLILIQILDLFNISRLPRSNIS